MVDRTLTVYKEGLLYKRQRGLHKSNTKALKFQERFCRLTSTSLDYYDPNPRKRVRTRIEIRGLFASLLAKDTYILHVFDASE